MFSLQLFEVKAMNTQLNQNFLKSLPMVASILANKLGVSVELGTNCCTNGRVIELPLKLNERAISREELLGFMVHEASHIRFTNFRTKPSCDLHFKLMNALEDSRIEKRIIGEYAGAHYLLNKCYEPSLQSMLKTINRMDPATVFVSYALFATESSFNRLFAKPAEVARRRGEKLFGDAVMTKVDAVLANFGKLCSTDDVCDMAKKLLAILKKKAEDAPCFQPDGSQQSNSENPETGSENTNENGKANENVNQGQGTSKRTDLGNDARKAQQADSNSEAQSSSSNDSSADESSSSDSGTDSGSGSDSASDKHADNAKQALESSVKSIKSIDLSEQLREKIAKSAATDQSRYSFSTSVTQDNKCPNVTCPDRDKRRGRKLLEQALADSVVARRSLLGAIQTKARTGYYTADRGRRISLSRMSRLTTGSARIFERRQEVRAVDTSVSILLDLSGSVGPKSELAIRACLAMLTALRSISFVKSTLNVFPSTAAGCHNNQGNYIKVVPFEDKLEKHVDLFGTLSSYGGTPLAEAVLGAAAEIAQRPERKKMIFVITDGRVTFDAQTILRELKRSGCALVGILVDAYDGSDSLKECFDLIETLQGFDDLQQKLMSISQALVLKGLC